MFTLGLDYGTNSVRALIVRCSDGAEYGSRVVDYPSGAQGILLDPKDGLLARQHPPDYLFGLEESVKGALAEARRKPDFDAGEGRRDRRGFDRIEPDPGRRAQSGSRIGPEVEERPQRAVLAVEGSHELARGGQDH